MRTDWTTILLTVRASELFIQDMEIARRCRGVSLRQQGQLDFFLLAFSILSNKAMIVSIIAIITIAQITNNRLPGDVTTNQIVFLCNANQPWYIKPV